MQWDKTQRPKDVKPPTILPLIFSSLPNLLPIEPVSYDP